MYVRKVNLNFSLIFPFEIRIDQIQIDFLFFINSGSRPSQIKRKKEI